MTTAPDVPPTKIISEKKSNCIKEYFFVDEKISMFIITIDTTHWQPKNILTELCNTNNDPDTSSLKKDKLGSAQLPLL